MSVRQICEEKENQEDQEDQEDQENQENQEPGTYVEIDYIESSQTFNSMLAEKADSFTTPPTARTHRRHLKKLNNFLAIIPPNESALRREVLNRRLDMLARRWQQPATK
ncbi:unnamed protein product [Effrenium voratum]|uniref:Uncharacterized protein n=1 Tax=Effrenium voratum TaxID=2562239 RepID=A0AA36IBG3_9DINO|nr:unnamed protein product [Effrenium voratum]